MSEYARALGAALRDVRQRAGLSLQRVELKSNGHLKAVVIGSYERGDRAVTVTKLAELARFYGVPISEFLPPDELGVGPEIPAPIVLNLDRLHAVTHQNIEPLVRYATDITQRRGSHETLIQIRAADLDALAELYGVQTPELVELLVSWGVLRPGVV